MLFINIQKFTLWKSEWNYVLIVQYSVMQIDTQKCVFYTNWEQKLVTKHATGLYNFFMLSTTQLNMI